MLCTLWRYVRCEPDYYIHTSRLRSMIRVERVHALHERFPIAAFFHVGCAYVLIIEFLKLRKFNNINTI